MKFLERFKMPTKGMGQQKELIFWGIKYGVVITFFLVIFLPIQGRLSNYSNEKGSLKGQIEDLKKITTSLLTPEEIQRVRDRVDSFEKGLGDETKANVIINQVSNLAEKSNLKLIQIYSDSPILAKNGQGQELLVDGKKLQLLPVNFRVQSDFKGIGNFLKTLADNASWTFTVESMEIKASATEAEGLQCDLTLSFITR